MLPFDLRDDLERGIASIKDSLRQSGDDQRPEWSTELEPQLEQVSSAYDASATTDCLNQFVMAELDFVSQGDRGLGRLSTEIPRYGAHLRKHLRRLSSSDLFRLATLIRTQIVTGWLAFVVAREDPVQVFPPAESSELYRRWIPNIYSGAIVGAIDDQTARVLLGLGAAAMKEHIDFLRQHQVRGGSMFTKDKTELILSHYHVAGFALRIAQHMLAQGS